MVGGTGKIFVPAPGQMVFTYVETENPTGGPPRTITFTNVEVEPLGYEHLVAARGQSELTIPLNMINGRVLETDVDGADASLYAHFQATFTTRFTSKAIGLVRGGWLPSAFGATRPETIVLLDRNIVTEIVGRFKGDVQRAGAPDFFDMFAQAPVRINPALYVMEGNRQSLPSPNEVRQQLDEAVRKLSRALPRAELIVVDETPDAIIMFLEDSREIFLKRQAFLIRVAPTLAAPVSRGRVELVWRQVIEAALSCGVSPKDLLVLAVLSVVATPAGGPARGLLKFKASYGEPDAYNALCDIRALDHLLNCQAHFPHNPVQLCTGDRALALFWVALGARIVRDEDGFSMSTTPHAQLFSAEDFARWNAIEG